jgi:hypothetical protein
MTNYARIYRLGMTPWEKYGKAAAATIAARLDREDTDRTRPVGRALDLGCCPQLRPSPSQRRQRTKHTIS